MRTDTGAAARRRRWAGSLLVLAVLVAGAGGSAVARGMVERMQQRHAGQLMDGYADDVSLAVSNEADRYLDTLADVAASAGAQSDFTADDFAAITSRLSRQRLPGAAGLSFAVPADDGQLAAEQARWRAQGAAELRFSPAATGRQHVFVVFNRPFDDSPPTTGRDLSAAAEPAEALHRARSSADVVASRTFVLLKDRSLPATRHQLAFLLCAPVIGGDGTPQAGRFLGWMVMGMRGGDFLDETLRARPVGAVGVTLLDASSGNGTVVAQSDVRAGPPALTRHREVAVAGRTWRLQVTPTAGLLNPTDRRIPGVTLAVGLVITFLLSVLVAVLAGARNRAMTRVDQATAALREDIERRKQVEAQLHHLALHDPLTGLANRALLRDRLQHALLSHRRSPTGFAVLFVDLDGFKQINDSAGHQAGDRILIEVADRLRQRLRAGDTVARLGGDEFAVLTERLAAPEHADTVAAHVVEALRTPFTVDGRPVTVTASVGVTVHAPHAAELSADEILQRADQAMYTAKTSGKNRYAVATGTAAVPAAATP